MILKNYEAQLILDNFSFRLETGKYEDLYTGNESMAQTIEALYRAIEVKDKALEKSKTALKVWVNTYASDHCNEKNVAWARNIIRESMKSEEDIIKILDNYKKLVELYGPNMRDSEIYKDHESRIAMLQWILYGKEQSTLGLIANTNKEIMEALALEAG